MWLESRGSSRIDPLKIGVSAWASNSGTQVWPPSIVFHAPPAVEIWIVKGSDGSTAMLLTRPEVMAVRVPNVGPLLTPAGPTWCQPVTPGVEGLALDATPVPEI